MVHIDENNFAIFDIFADNSGREAYFVGQVSGLLNKQALRVFVPEWQPGREKKRTGMKDRRYFRKNVCSVTHICLITSKRGIPCPVRTSTCRNFVTISSGLGRLFAMCFLRFPKHCGGPLQWEKITKRMDGGSTDHAAYCHFLRNVRTTALDNSPGKKQLF